MSLQRPELRTALLAMLLVSTSRLVACSESQQSIEGAEVGAQWARRIVDWMRA